MKIDINTYRVQREPVKCYLKAHPDMAPTAAVSNLSLMTNTPLIVMAHFVAEVVGMTPELQKQIDGLIDFYHYTEIIV